MKKQKWIDEINEAWKLWSVRLSAFFGALTAVWLVTPEPERMAVLQVVGDAFGVTINPGWVPAIGFGLVLYSRLRKQNNVGEPKL